MYAVTIIQSMHFPPDGTETQRDAHFCQGYTMLSQVKQILDAR